MRVERRNLIEADHPLSHVRLAARPVVGQRKRQPTEQRGRLKNMSSRRRATVREELPFARAREGNVVFETGRPVSFTFIRNTEKSPHFGALYQQNVEPAGRYLLLDTDPSSSLVRGWTRGTVSFRSPLVIRFSETGRYDDTSWKAVLARHFRARGRTLSRAIQRAGYDGIVTVAEGETREIVDLNVIR